MTGQGSGPLAGLRVIELAGQGPLPLAATMLADAGASVIRVVRPGTPPRHDPTDDAYGRSRRSIVLDLKKPEGMAVLRDLIAQSDVLLEGYRPGVLERMGLDPAELRERHPALVIGRMTGWGQGGPLASAAGHDLNYIAVTGLLDAIGTAEDGPVVPLNLVGDYGGGGMLLAFGVVAACLRAARTGEGDVIDAAMVDGASLLGGLFYSLVDRGAWGPRGTNIIDGGAHFYRPYRTADGRWMSVAAIEPQFYAELLRVLGVDAADAPQRDRGRWAELSRRFEEIFATRSQAEWTALFDGVDACVAPVMTLADAHTHPHMSARGVLADVGGHRQPAPAPRFASHPAPQPTPSRADGADTVEILRELGRTETEISALLAGAAAQEKK